MQLDVEEYVKTCLICQQDKPITKKKDGTLQSLPVSERPWASVSMEFIMQLLEAQGYNGIMVVEDWFSKYVTLIPMKVPCTASDVVKLFFKNIMNMQGFSLSIVMDRDAWFT